MQSSLLNVTAEATDPPSTTIDQLNLRPPHKGNSVKATDHRKQPATTEASMNGAGGIDSAGMSSRQVTSSSVRTLLRNNSNNNSMLYSSDSTNSTRQNIVAKLRRDRWPETGKAEQSSSNEFERRLRGNRGISDEKLSIKRISFQRNDRTDTDTNEPLIHTDKLNTTSPLLYVHSSLPATNRNKIQINQQNRRQQSQIQTSNKKSFQNDLDQAAESSMSSAQLAILSATGAPDQSAASLDQTANESRPDSLSNRSDQPKLVPRLVVLNLEVGSSTATLTWTLALFPVDEDGPTNDSSSSSSRPSLSPILTSAGVDDKVSGTIHQVTSVIGSSSQAPLSNDKPTSDQNSVPPNESSQALAINENDTQQQKAARQQQRRSDKSFTKLNQGEPDQDEGDGLVGSTEPSGSSYGSSRLIVKRDTIRVTPTLNRQNSAGIGNGHDNNNSNTRRVQDESDDKRARRDRPTNELAAEEREMDLSSLPAEDDGGHLDLLRTKPDEDVGTPSTSVPSTRPNTPTTTTSSTTTAEPIGELSLGMRFQMSRIQSLPAGGHNRRPPTRRVSTNNDETGTTESRSPPETISTAASVQVVTSAPARGSSTVLPEAKRSLRFVSRRKTKPSTSTTTTSTTTTTTAEPRRLESTPPGLESSDSTKEGPESIEPSAKSSRAAKSLASDRDATTESGATLVSGPEAELITTTTLPAKSSSIETRNHRADAMMTPESATTKSVQLAEPPANGNTLSPVDVIRQQQAATSVSSSTAEPHIVISPTDKSVNEPTNQVADVSKWLVRLRKFASNEVDIVKVLVNNLNRTSLKQQQMKPVLRYITFKELEPSSAYELCIESASPNQQVGDKFQVLDANHFLKCFDSSDVELSNSSSGTNSTLPGNSIRRMDFDSAKSLPAHELEQLDTDNDNPIAMPLNAGADGEMKNDHQYNHQQPYQMEDTQVKMKSLCKEFLTLPANSTETINFGQYDVRQTVNSRTTNGSTNSRKLQQTTSSSFESAFIPPLWNNSVSSVANPRRAKSLNNALKSHMELLEINDFNEPAISSNNRQQSMVFEMAASRANGGRLMPTGSDNYVTRLAGVTDQSAGVQSSNGNLSATGRNNHELITMSLLPVVGCIFGLIFIITLANIILSAISCRSLRARRRRASGAGMAAHSGMLSHNLQAGRTSSKHTLGSFYGSDSDHSGTSQSRMVIVGKYGEPFGAGSAYFEVPNEALANRGHSASGVAEQSSLAGSSSGSGGKHSSNFLLSNSARFPLGPSFEGDEKHNADMVGLARKNYDNFINHIYNEGPQADRIDAAQKTATLNGQTVSNSNRNQALKDQKTHHNHRHHHHHHHHHKRNTQQVQATVEIDQAGTSRTRFDQENLQHRENEAKLNLDEPNSAEQYAKTKRQRIRFDKINPIYNMNGLCSISTGDVSSNRRLKSPFGVSSFGYTNSASIVEENDERRSVSTSSSDYDAHCPVCQSESGAELHNKNVQQVEPVSQICEAGENCEEAAYYTCCLDRQKQRFNKQQQQLAKVMTKNGSLVPQPFINPIGPPRCGSPSCESIVREHDQQRAAAEDPQQQQVGNLDSNLTVQDKLSQDSVDSISQHEKEDQEVIEMSKVDTEETSLETKPHDFFIFGEHSSNMPELDANQAINIGHEQTTISPTPPQPPSPLSAGTPTPDIANQNRKVLVKVAAMEEAGKESGTSTYGAINKNDFNQRRTELASKLHLAGMVKPPGYKPT